MVGVVVFVLARFSTSRYFFAELDNRNVSWSGVGPFNGSRDLHACVTLTIRTQKHYSGVFEVTPLVNLCVWQPPLVRRVKGPRPSRDRTSPLVSQYTRTIQTTIWSNDLRRKTREVFCSQN